MHKHPCLHIEHDLLNSTWNDSQDSFWKNFREVFMFPLNWVQLARIPSTVTPQRKKHTEFKCPGPSLAPHPGLMPILLPSCDLPRCLATLGSYFPAGLLLLALVLIIPLTKAKFTYS